MQARNILAIALLAIGTAGVALAGHGGKGDGEEGEGEGGHRIHYRHHASIEHMAMRNIMVELLSAKTGKSTAEIAALFEQEGPRDAFESLGLKREDVQPLRQQAREQLLAKATAAGLITTAQAEKIRSQPVHERRVRYGKHDERSGAAQ